ncbi:SAM-dependent methyltransferase [Streptomyces nigra]|uniref:SAM-dependent methyltransferase n=1 Tax=Streptomyces nigra TaxID=1827580 RepID=UPI00382D6EB4
MSLETSSNEAVSLEESLASVAALGVTSNHGALLRGALSSGFLQRCVKPISASRLVDETGIDKVRIESLCAALTALGMLTTDDGARYSVASAYRPLLGAGVDRFALSRLEASAVKERILRQVFTQPGEVGYWSLDAESRRRIADGVTVDPTTDFARHAMRATIDAIPNLSAAFTEGARYLELGCGVGGAMLTYLQLYPRVRAVGVELAADLVEVARTRASDLGLSDRVAFHTADACVYTDPESFDVVFWSQFFFTHDTRKAALTNAFSHLRSGGLLIAPVLRGRPADGSLPDSQAALDELFYGAWGVPIKSAEELVLEVQSAGFRGASVSSSSFAVVVTARRP